jgi:type VI secretion system protein VasG
VFCKLRGNPYVELVHWVQQILQTPDSDLHRIVRHFELDAGRLAGDVTNALDRLPRGATSISDLSDHVEHAVERGWVYGSLMFRESQVRTGHLLIGMLKTPSLRGALMAISREFERIRGDTLTDEFAKIVAGSPEEFLSAADGSAQPARPAAPSRRPSWASRRPSSASPPTSPSKPAPARWTRSSAATRRSARWSTSSCGGARTTPS